MTRINVGISPKLLTDKHLLAEHREIKRIPNVIKSGKANFDGIPTTFSLGKGHVKFFYNKLKYLYLRYSAIHGECINRGFNVQDYSGAFSLELEDIELQRTLWKGYKPTEKDIKIILSRLRERDIYYDSIDINKVISLGVF